MTQDLLLALAVKTAFLNFLLWQAFPVVIKATSATPKPSTLLLGGTLGEAIQGQKAQIQNNTRSILENSIAQRRLTKELLHKINTTMGRQDELEYPPFQRDFKNYVTKDELRNSTVSQRRDVMDMIQPLKKMATQKSETSAAYYQHSRAWNETLQHFTHNLDIMNRTLLRFHDTIKILKDNMTQTSLDYLGLNDTVWGYRQSQTTKMEAQRTDTRELHSNIIDLDQIARNLRITDKELQRKLSVLTSTVQRELQIITTRMDAFALAQAQTRRTTIKLSNGVDVVVDLKNAVRNDLMMFAQRFNRSLIDWVSINPLNISGVAIVMRNLSSMTGFALIDQPLAAVSFTEYAKKVEIGLLTLAMMNLTLLILLGVAARKHRNNANRVSEQITAALLHRPLREFRRTHQHTV